MTDRIPGNEPVEPTEPADDELSRAAEPAPVSDAPPRADAVEDLITEPNLEALVEEDPDLELSGITRLPEDAELAPPILEVTDLTVDFRTLPATADSDPVAARTRRVAGRAWPSMSASRPSLGSMVTSVRRPPGRGGSSTWAQRWEQQRSFDELGRPLRELTFCVVDLETTGGSPAGGSMNCRKKRPQALRMIAPRGSTPKRTPSGSGAKPSTRS